MSGQQPSLSVSLVSQVDRVSRALSELQRGAPIILVDGDEAAVATAAELLEPLRLQGLRSLAGQGHLSVTAARASTLKARAYDGDLARIRLNDAYGAPEIRAVADPALDLERPLLGPHLTLRDGSAGLDRLALKLCKMALLLPAAAIWPLPSAEAGRAMAARYELITLESALLEKDASWTPVVAARLPVSVSEHARLHVYRRGAWGDEHYALEIGEPDRSQPVLTRLHSACVTGDLFGSLKCDCGPQLQAALEEIGRHGSGVLVYLLQEGRGIGLANKLRAYRLQDQGFDTVEANHRLGFEDDERILRDGGDILRRMGFSKARLMTNNPNKLDALTKAGVEVVERVPLIVGRNPRNDAYLKVKAQKSGHLL